MYKQNYIREDVLTARQYQLLCTLHRLWIEHVLWTRFFIISTANNSGDLNAVTARLLRNPSDFANALRPFYGNQNAMQFEKLLSEHLQIAAKLVNAAKAGNTAAADTQRQKWYANADDIAYFLSEINPYFSRTEWQAMLYDHLKMTENEAVQVLTGQFAPSIEQYDAIQSQALKMADEMARGLYRQFRI